MTKFVGTGVALITPFNKDLSVDFDALTKLVEYNIANGIEYLVISGTTGESATITREEKEAHTPQGGDGYISRHGRDRPWRAASEHDAWEAHC